MINSILKRYIAKHVLQATALATLLVMAVLFLLLLLGELKNINEGDYGLTQAILYVLMRLPNELYQFTPMLILLGGIIGLSILSTHRELIVMRVSGLRSRQIILGVFFGVFFVMLTMAAVGEWFAPGLSYKAEIRKENARNAGQAVITGSGVWYHIDNNFIHIERVVGHELLEGITRYQFDDAHHLQAAYYARKLSLDHKEWHMYDVTKTSFLSNQTRSETLADVPLDLKINTNLLRIGLLNPNEMSLSRLLKFSSYLKQNNLQAAEFQYEFWRRMFQPIASIIMILLSAPFVLGAFSRSPMGWRILIGIFTGFAFFIANAFFGQLCIVFQFPAFIAAALPLTVFMFLGMLFANKLIRH